MFSGTRRILTLAIAALAFCVSPVFSQSNAQSQRKKTPEPTYKVGDVAPDFTLRDQSGKEVSLHDFHGKKNVVLAFYVFAFSGG